MVQPKYSPEEALQKIKLMMSYDMSKTLNENKEMLISFGMTDVITKPFEPELFYQMIAKYLTD